MYFRFVSGVTFRRFNSNFHFEAIKNVHFFPQNHGKVNNRLRWCKRKMTIWLQEQSIQVMKACTKQFEFIAEQRVRRSLQIFRRYTRLWDEVALQQFIKLCRFRITKNTRNFLMGAVGVKMYDWDQERIPDEHINNYAHEIEEIHKLQDLTIVCHECGLRLVIDVSQPKVKYCQCYKVNHATNVSKTTDWEPFTECEDMIIWRREEKDSRGLYSYKVYGSFDDVSAEDFLQVQIDLDYRAKWDSTVKQLKIVDTDPLHNESKDGCNDIIYWEMIWPRMFANRDYVYKRKWFYNKETNIVIIVNKETKHPNAPNRSDTYRVTTYWSFMVIKPLKSFHEPGVEFGLTYFDDPGMNVPAVTTWIIMSGLTNYLYQMRQAIQNYKNYKALHVSKSTLFNNNTTINQDNKTDTSTIGNQQGSREKCENISNNTINEMTTDLKARETKSLVIDKSKNENENENEENENKENENENENEDEENENESENDLIDEEDRSLLNYFFLTKLFV